MYAVFKVQYPGLNYLRPKRPMVLHWRRCGRTGGRQIKKRKTGKPDKDRTGFTSDLRRKEIFFLND